MGNARILLIDDEPIVRRIICRYLSCIYEVHPVESASEALTLFEKGFACDVILCDLNMDGVSGIDFFHRIWERDPELVARIIFITGGAIDDKSGAFLRRTGVPCIHKPFLAPVLFQQISRVLALNGFLSQSAAAPT